MKVRSQTARFMVLRATRSAFSVCVCLLLFGVAERAHSQQSDAVALQEITVTATKRAESLQDVPFAISALSGSTLDAMNAQSFEDYARSIPGLTFTDYGGGRSKPAIRGLTASTGSSVVGYYIGETPLPSTDGTVRLTVANPDLVDMDRIEVLRGPQGTLYGSGSVGGIIRLIPNLPDLDKILGSVSGAATVTQGVGGASPGFNGNAVFNVPIVQGLAALRTVFWARDTGGFVDRTYGYTGISRGSLIPLGRSKTFPTSTCGDFARLFS